MHRTEVEIRKALLEQWSKTAKATFEQVKSAKEHVESNRQDRAKLARVIMHLRNGEMRRRKIRSVEAFYNHAIAIGLFSFQRLVERARVNPATLREELKQRKSELEAITDVERWIQSALAVGVKVLGDEPYLVWTVRLDKYGPDENGDLQDIGEFELTVDMMHNHLRVSRLTMGDEQSGRFVHPHIIPGGDSLCLGEHEAKVKRMLRTGNFVFARHWIDAVMRGYNSEAAYQSLELVLGTGETCGCCEAAVSEDELYYIESIDRQYCGECSAFCDLCEAQTPSYGMCCDNSSTYACSWCQEDNIICSDCGRWTNCWQEEDYNRYCTECAPQRCKGCQELGFGLNDDGLCPQCEEKKAEEEEAEEEKEEEEQESIKHVKA